MRRVRPGLQAYILSDEIEGESREVGKVHAALARAVARRGQPFARPCVILSGGETTVTVRPRAEGAATRPRRPGRRVLHGAGAGAAGPAGRLCAGRRHRRHRRRRGQRRRLRGAADTLARAAAQGMKVDALPGPQRRLRLFRAAGRPGLHRADLHQRQRFPGDSGAVSRAGARFVPSLILLKVNSPNPRHIGPHVAPRPCSISLRGASRWSRAPCCCGAGFGRMRWSMSSPGGSRWA